MTAVLGGPGELLDPEAVRSFVRTQVGGLDLAGRSLCVVIPDGTRNCPLPLLLEAIEAGVDGRTSDWTAVVALGTHAPMSDDALRALVGPTSLGLSFVAAGLGVSLISASFARDQVLAERAVA